MNFSFLENVLYFSIQSILQLYFTYFFHGFLLPSPIFFCGFLASSSLYYLFFPGFLPTYFPFICLGVLFLNFRCRLRPFIDHVNHDLRWCATVIFCSIHMMMVMVDLPASISFSLGFISSQSNTSCTFLLLLQFFPQNFILFDIWGHLIIEL